MAVVEEVIGTLGCFLSVCWSRRLLAANFLLFEIGVNVFE